MCSKDGIASTFEGGFLAAIICVEAKQNSALGSRFGKFVKRNAHLGKGSKFRVKIKNFNCKKELGLGYKLGKRDTSILKSDGSSKQFHSAAVHPTNLAKRQKLPIFLDRDMAITPGETWQSLCLFE